MKRLIVLILVCALLVGCTPQVDNDGAEPTTSTTETQQTVEYIFTEEGMPEFTGLDDSALLTYMEDSIYTNLITALTFSTKCISLRMSAQYTFPRNT